MRDMHVVSQKNREYLERMNPCLVEENLTRRCLGSNDYDKEKCGMYFQNIRICREFWDYVKRDRRIRGIHPILPPSDERAKIKAEYLKNNGNHPRV